MQKYTKEEILKIAEERDVKFVRLQFTDIHGQPKNVAITVRQLEKALNNECMFDGSSIEGFVRIEESDMYLRPDYNTFVIFPWSESGARTARLICDVYNPDGTPFEGDPRYVLKKEIEHAAKLGYTFNVGPECEFYLFHIDEDGNPTTITNDKGGYFDLAPIDRGEACRRDICLTLEEMGFEIEASHHEVAAGQHEIGFKYDEVLAAADNTITFRFVVKTIALRHNLHATFMPKPIFGASGSGMHTNMSLFKDGKNAFYDEADELGLSQDAYHFIAGLIEHVKSMSIITNPLVNSYKRLVPGYEAPVYIAWSAHNRSPLIRVPASRGAATRLELRNADPACNPYLEMAVCLAAGLDGIERGLTPPPAIDSNIYAMTRKDLENTNIETLPASLQEAIRAFKGDPFMMQTLGDHVYKKYLHAKQHEWDEYRMRVSQWELDSYLKKY